MKFSFFDSAYEEAFGDIDVDNSHIVDYRGQADYLVNYNPVDSKLPSYLRLHVLNAFILLIFLHFLVKCYENTNKNIIVFLVATSIKIFIASYKRLTCKMCIDHQCLLKLIIKIRT